MQLQGLDLAAAEHGGHRPPVHQFHPFFKHVVQVFRRGRHLVGVGFHRDHGYFHGALPQRFAGAVDGGVSAADDGYASTQLDFGCAHADVAKERKSVKHAVLILALGAHAIGLG